MNTNDSIFQRALSKLLTEIFDGPPGSEAYMLNPGDPGLVATARIGPGARRLPAANAGQDDDRRTRRSRSLRLHAPEPLGRAARRTRGPMPTGTRAGNAQTVTDDEWRTLRDKLRREAEAWQKAVRTRTEWDDITAAGALSSVAHTAYHVGAIRQILAALESPRHESGVVIRSPLSPANAGAGRR